ncbi:serine hydrolase [Streptomyces sp. NPDC056682]|uniref:D-alanyl-D-alanine carboxypeptidase n=1 Tax=Streptomyces sp. NPDC056682 TaxID=3345909 RepID=UPI0036C83778
MDQATAVFRAPRQEDGDSRLRAAVAAWVDQEADGAGDSAVAAKAEGVKAELATPEDVADRGGAKPEAAEPEGVAAGADAPERAVEGVAAGADASEPARAAGGGTADGGAPKGGTPGSGSGAKGLAPEDPDALSSRADKSPAAEPKSAAKGGAPESPAAEPESAADGGAPETPAAEPQDAAKGGAPQSETRGRGAAESEDGSRGGGARREAPQAPAKAAPAMDDAAEPAAPKSGATKSGVAEASGDAKSAGDATATDAARTTGTGSDAKSAGAAPTTGTGAGSDAKSTGTDTPAPGSRGTSWGAKQSPATGSGTDQPRPAGGSGNGTDRPSSAGDSGSGIDPSAPAVGNGGTHRPSPAEGGNSGTAQSGPAEGGTRGTDQPGPATGSSGTDKPSTTSGNRGVDQPTTAFKAVAPPAVDQPTAMLKLPSPKREAPAERASQFVPLRTDDAGAGTDAPVRQPGAPKITPPPVVAPPQAMPEHAERTKQQPLPPKPPLDLLAELTNTPPPPQTPVRTTVRRFKIWTPLVLLLLVVFAVVQIVRPLPSPRLALTSSATYTFAGDALGLPWPAEGQSAVSVDGVGSLGTHGEQKPAPLASVAKTMTAYVILKEHPISGKQEGPKITVDQQAEDDAKKPDESTAPIRKDQQFTEKQMLELLMIPSGNNAARLLARWDAGNEEAFIAKMNATAKELGMTSSSYTDPSGLKETTVSTPTDQLKLAQAVMQNDVFRGIVNTPQIKIPGIPTTIYNNNTILLKPGVSGIKTGSSTPAGGNLLWAADTVVDGKNQRIYGIVMGQHTGTTLDSKLKAAINNSYTLIQAVQKAVTSATVVKKGDVVGYVDNGLGGKTPLVAAKDLKAIGWPGLKVDVTIGDGGKAVPHSAKAGTVVGELSIGSGPGRQTAPVELGSAMAEPGIGDKLTRLG